MLFLSNRRQSNTVLVSRINRTDDISHIGLLRYECTS